MFLSTPASSMLQPTVDDIKSEAARAWAGRVTHLPSGRLPYRRNTTTSKEN